MKKMLALLLVMVMAVPVVVWGQVSQIQVFANGEKVPPAFRPIERNGNVYINNSIFTFLGLGVELVREQGDTFDVRISWYGDPHTDVIQGVIVGTGRFNGWFPISEMNRIRGLTATWNAQTRIVELILNRDIDMVHYCPEYFRATRRPVRISEPTFFSQEELRELIRYAYPAYLTIPSRPHPNRRMNQQELEEWIEEFWVMGINREELQMLYYTNEARVRYGSRPAKLCPYQSMAARLMAQLRLEGHTHGHTDLFYGSPRDRIRLFHPTMGTTENAAGSPNPYHAVGGLLNSPGHRWNLLARYSDNPCFGHGNLGAATFQKMVSCP